MNLHLSNFIQCLVLIGLIAGLQSQSTPQLKLRGKAYKLNYQVQNQDGSYEAEELHSAAQGRSKMHYKAHGNEDEQSSKTFYSDGRHVVEISPDATSCSQVAPGQIDQNLHISVRTVLKNFNHSHLIGAGRLLSFLELNWAKFSLEITNTSQDVEYNAQFESGTVVNTIRLIYARDESQNLPNGIPKKILIARGSSEQQVAFNIIQYQTLSDSFQSIESVNGGTSLNATQETNSVSYDLFFFDRAIGCSKVLTQEWWIDQCPTRFSFITKSPAAGDAGPIDMTVAYEPSLSILKTNQTLGDTSIHSIVNFKADHKFHFIEKLYNEHESNSSTQVNRERSCVMSQSRIHTDFNNPTGGPFTVGQMLLGVSKFVYLGLARVRDIEAKVYEAHNCDWPVWLQQPLVYEQSNRMKVNQGKGLLARPVSLEWRDELALMNEQQVSMTNVFYFEKTSFLLESKLLLIEMFLKDERSGRVIKQSIFPIYNFSWDLPKTNPVGERYENSFSLQDHCLASSEESNFASINLLFEARANNYKLEWLEDGTKRNLAILSIAQSQLHFHPMSVIYDIGSRLTIGAEVPNSHRSFKPDREISIAVHMKAAERMKSLTRTLHICKANPSTEQFESFQTYNFQSCHSNAAHRRVDTFMAFNVRTSECLIMKDDLALENEPSELVGKICNFGQTSGDFVVYQILHHDKWDDFSSFEQAKNLLQFTDDTRMLNPVKLGDQDLGIKLRLRRFEIGELGKDFSHDLSESGNRRILGFGLDSTEPQNKLVDLNSTQRPNDYQPEVMQIENCRTACLADVECQSFSVCVIDGKARCVLSTVSFSTPSMVLQMMTLADSEFSLENKSQVRIDLEEQRRLIGNNGLDGHNGFINVIKCQTCELHNKIYSDYFKQAPSKSKFTGAQRIFRPVVSANQCAELCFRKTIESIKELSSSGATHSNHIDQDQEASQGKGVCNLYYFISKQQLEPDISVTINKHLVDIGHQGDVDGFCVIGDHDSGRPAENEAHIRHEAMREITFDAYLFDYSILYTKEPDVSLAKSQLADGERRAIVNRINQATSEGLPVEETNENLDRLEECTQIPCVPECAKKCFNSKSAFNFLKCRSFDYIEIDHPDSRTLRFCAMNSITLQSTLEANRLDLVDRGSTIHKGTLATGPLDSVKVWHHEPRDLSVA